MNANTQRIIELSNGQRSSVEIAELVGLSPRYVRKVMKKFDLPRFGEGAQPGSRNHQFVSGRRVDHDGCALVTAPKDHPYARQLSGRKTKVIFEHRLVMEQKLGRYLLPEEVVDHVDGLTLHNAPDNLRLFASNGDHLAQTATGPRMWSPEGMKNIGARTDLGVEIQRVDSYGQRRARGEVRVQQILLAALSLGIDSPFLLGTHRHLEKAGIDPSCRSNLERALADLYARWGWPPPQFG